MSEKKILVADYNTRELQRIKRVLEESNYEVITVQDGKRALDNFFEQMPDMVLVSAMLSKINGFDVCKRIKESEEGKNTPVIILTSVYKGHKYRIKALHENKASEFLEKPIPDEKLLGIISKLLGDTRALIETTKKTTMGKETGSTSHEAVSKEEPVEVEEKPLEIGKEKSISSPEQKAKKTLLSDETNVDELLKEEITSTLIAAEGEEESKETEDSLDKMLSETLSGLGIEVEKGKVTISQMPAHSAEGEASEKEAEEAVQDLMIETREEEKKKEPLKEVDIGELKYKELEEEVVKGTESTPGEAAVSDLLKSFDTDLERKLSDTLSGVGLSDTSIDKVIETEETHKEKAKGEGTKAEVEEGTPFGDYMLLEKIGHGGMAELFRAKKKGEEGFRKIVAIKKILPHLSDNKELVTMFIDEAKIAAQLSHQNIANIFDFGKIDNSYYIAMEYVDGFDLKKILSKSKEKEIKFPHKLAAFICYQIANALDYAHHKKDFANKDLNIVHRDVSPQNILISREGEVKLVDFGISKAESKIHHTVKGALKGKLLYMSPEQAWGKAVDNRSDLFSLGIVLCEMVSGKVLFEDSSEFDVLEKVRSGKIPLLENEMDNVPPGLKKIVDRALQIEVEKRYQSAADMAKDLHNYLNSEGNVPTSKDLSAYLKKLYPEFFGLSEKDVKGLSFGRFMEKTVATKIMSEETVILEGEEMEGLEELKPETEVTPPLEEGEMIVGEMPVAEEKEQKREKEELEVKPKKKKEKKKAVEKAEVVKNKERKEKVPSFGHAAEKKKSSVVPLVVAVVIVIALAVGGYLYLGKKTATPPKGQEKQVAETMPVQTENAPPADQTSQGQVQLPSSKGKQAANTGLAGAQKNIPIQKPSSAINVKTKPAKATVSRPSVQNAVKKSKPVQQKNKAQQVAGKKSLVLPAKARVQPVKTKTPTVNKPSPGPKTQQTTQSPPKETSANRTVPPLKKGTQQSKTVSKPVRGKKAKVVEKKPALKPTPKPSRPSVTRKVPTVKKVQMNLPGRNTKTLKEGDIVSLTPDVKPPKLVKEVKPRYPITARRMRLHARLICRILISYTGKVEKAMVISSNPSNVKKIFEASAKNALMKWVYTPAVKNGLRVRVWKTVIIAF